MLRRSFLALTALAPAAALAFQSEKSKLKISSVRLVNPRARRPVPSYTPAPGSWSTTGVEVASPMSIYPEYKSNRALFMPEPGSLDGFTVEIATDKGVKGYGEGGMAGGVIVEKHLTKLLLRPAKRQFQQLRGTALEIVVTFAEFLAEAPVRAAVPGGHVALLDDRSDKAL